MMHHVRAIGFFALAVACGSGLLAIATATPAPNSILVLATLPPSPTPVPPLPIVRRDLFAGGAETSSANQLTPTQGNRFNVASGVLGVSLAGDASVASVMLGGHIYWVRLGSLLGGHRVISIAMNGITLDNGMHIARGSELTTSQPQPIVPAITSTPVPFIEPTPPAVTDDRTPAPVTMNPQSLIRSLRTPTPFHPSSFPVPPRLEPPQ